MTLQEEYQQLSQQIAHCDHQGDYVGLAQRMEHFLELTVQLYGEDSAQYATALNDYGGIHRDIGNYEKAEQAFLQAADLISRLQGIDHPDYGSVLNNLAGLYRLMKQYQKAEQCFQQALQIYETTLGEQHFFIYQPYEQLGVTLSGPGPFAEAEALHAQSLTLFGEDSR